MPIERQYVALRAGTDPHAHNARAAFGHALDGVPPALPAALEHPVSSGPAAASRSRSRPTATLMLSAVPVGYCSVVAGVAPRPKVPDRRVRLNGGDTLLHQRALASPRCPLKHKRLAPDEAFCQPPRRLPKRVELGRAPREEWLPIAVRPVTAFKPILERQGRWGVGALEVSAHDRNSGCVGRIILWGRHRAAVRFAVHRLRCGEAWSTSVFGKSRTAGRAAPASFSNCQSTSARGRSTRTAALCLVAVRPGSSPRVRRASFRQHQVEWPPPRLPAPLMRSSTFFMERCQTGAQKSGFVALYRNRYHSKYSNDPYAHLLGTPPSPPIIL